MIAKNDFFANVSKGRLGNLQNQNKTRSLKQVNSGKIMVEEKHGGICVGQ
jgi:hypothetical protein